MTTRFTYAGLLPMRVPSAGRKERGPRSAPRGEPPKEQKGTEWPTTGREAREFVKRQNEAARREFPERFGLIEEAQAFCQDFFTWYNTEHHHSGIGLLTPEVVHYGWSPHVLAQRGQVLASAYAAHPERFVHKPPTPPAVPSAVWFNRPQPSPEGRPANPAPSCAEALQ